MAWSADTDTAAPAALLPRTDTQLRLAANSLAMQGNFQQAIDMYTQVSGCRASRPFVVSVWGRGPPQVKLGVPIRTRQLCPSKPMPSSPGLLAPVRQCSISITG